MIRMHVTHRRGRILAICAAVAMIQACSNAGSPRSGLAAMPVLPSNSFGVQRLDQGGMQLQPFTASNLPRAIYIADAVNNIVAVFGADGKLSATIADGVQSPSGLLVDGNQNLWVANSTYVSVYPKGATKPNRILQDPNERPADISVAQDGTVYVSNFFGSSVSVYARGSDTPTKKLRDSNAQYVVGVASDPSGNVFATINDPTGVGYIDEFIAGKQSGFKRLPPRFSFAGDIKFDNAGNLLVLDETQYSITEFTEAGHRTGLGMFTYHQWNAFDVSRDSKYIAATVALPDETRGVLKTFPLDRSLLTFKDNFGGGIAGVAIAPGRFP